MNPASGKLQLNQLYDNLVALGAKRLVALGVIGMIVVAGVVLSASYLSRPSLEVLYSGLESQDVGRMAAVLERAGMPFDVNAEGNTLLVPYGATAKTRTLLAQQGLPSGASSGYELFDQLGSMGLTSFMQEVTRVRALEGEIARTVQSLEGVQAARVHLVLPEAGSFRRKTRAPSASVVVRLNAVKGEFLGAQAIRHLVAAAVPGMNVTMVSVLSTDGTVLAAAGDTKARAPHNMLELEGKLTSQVEEAAGNTLAPYLGLGNYRVNVALKVNTDRRTISEQTFDPESRVERSVRVVRQEGTSENRAGAPAVGVEQNIPQEEGGDANGDQSRRQEERREEVTNYELNTRQVRTESDGYRVDGMTIAVLVNRKVLVQQLGAAASDAAVDERLNQLSKIIRAATGFSEERGDQIEISAVEFLDANDLLDPVPDAGIVEHLMRNVGMMINALAAIVVVFLVVWFGLRPAVRALTDAPPARLEGQTVGEGSARLADNSSGETSGQVTGAGGEEGASVKLLPPKARLEQLIEEDEEQVVQILKQWIRKGVATP